MKKLLCVFAFAFMICLACGLVSCGEEEPEEYVNPTTMPVTVEYIVNGETYTTQEIDYLQAFDFPAAPEINGYLFEGWYLDEALTKPFLGPKFDMTKEEGATIAVFLSDGEEPTGDISQEAVQALSSEGKGAELGIEYKGTAGGAVMIPARPSLLYRYDGEDGRLYLVSQRISLYAKMTVIGDAIAFENLKGAEDELPAIYDASTAAVPLPAVHAEGFVFLGWSLGGNTVTEIPVGTEGDLTLTAVWAEASPDEYFVFRELNGGFIVEELANKDAEHVVIPETYQGKPVEEIAYGAFSEAYLLQSVIIPESMWWIEGGTFPYCSALSSITISPWNENYKSVNNCIIYLYNQSVVAGCKTSVIPADGSATKIADNAFVWCYGLKNIEIPAAITSVSSGAFLYCNGVESVTVAPENPVYYSENNCIIEKETGTLVLGCKNSVIPTDGSVTAIGDYAFFGCTGLREIAIPTSVTHIGESVFYRCEQLSELVIPNSVRTVGDGAFSYCMDLTEVVIPGSIESLGEGLFAVCLDLKTVVIEEGVKHLGEGTFSGCAELTSISIPHSAIPQEVKYPGIVDYDCKKLTTIVYAGTMSEWEALETDIWFWTADLELTITCQDGTLNKQYR